MRKNSKHLLLFVAILLAVIAAVGTVFVCAIAKEADDITLDVLKMDKTSFIYAWDEDAGEYVEFDRIFDEENRIWVDYNKIPKDMINAFVAIEDERFFSHEGFDMKRLIGATADFISNGSEAYGASTITQQLVKNLSGEDEVKLKRKIQEIYRAVRLEQKYSKEEILEFYLNTIYLSRQCNGIQAASRRYFNKDVGELSLAETASIAGITQFPTKFDPISNPENNKNKQKIVLSKMLELGYITKDRYDEALAEELVFCKEDMTEDMHSTKTYFADTVIKEVLEDLQANGYQKQVALKMLYSGGLKIYASVDLKVQNAIESVFSDPSNFPASYGDDLLQSAIVVTDPYKGYIIGMSGGRGDISSRMTLNRATQTHRQPGSSIKPLSVYAPAVEYGIVTPSSVVIDEPINIDDWSPKNSNNSFSGAVTVKEAITRSLNIPAIKILQNVSIDTSFDFLKNNFGITSLVEKKEIDGKIYSDKAYSCLALGGLTEGVSVMEMAGAYGAFPNSGIYKKLTTYVKVCDYDGNTIMEGEGEDHQAMMADTADTMTEMLKNVVSYGTGAGAAISGIDTAGKTGTTDENKDRWFVGFTPYYVGAVWVGYDSPKVLTGMAQNPALIIWKRVMDKVHEGLPPKTFEKHEYKSGKIRICKVSGKLATSLCALDIRGSQVEYVEFPHGGAPTETCTAHKEYFLCYSSGERYHSGCGEKRRVSALGEADAFHSEKDGYITKKYCSKHSYSSESSYSICLDSGLLAGPNCPRTKTVTGSEKPSGTCNLAHGSTSGSHNDDEAAPSSGTATGSHSSSLGQPSASQPPQKSSQPSASPDVEILIE
ncbi:MAG: PBP1A family penicillin-binding protein [Clostridia bacterium]|nr:PBP1A family penicillin-binding protein [Clostridia bacterium]